MADSSYPYPPDQFDREAEASTYHGAHRAEEPFWRQNLLYIVIIAAAIVTLLVLLFVIGGMGRDGGTDTAATTTATTQAPPAEQQPSDGGGQAPAAPEGDRSTPVLVINAGGENGMAGKWRTALADKGWTAVDIQTAQSRQEQAVVFYRSEEDAASAQLLAQEAGVGEAQQSDEYDARITFVAVQPPQ